VCVTIRFHALRGNEVEGWLKFDLFGMSFFRTLYLILLIEYTKCALVLRISLPKFRYNQ